MIEFMISILAFVGFVTATTVFFMGIYHATPVFLFMYEKWKIRNFTTEQVAYYKLIARKAAQRKEKVDESQL